MKKSALLLIVPLVFIFNFVSCQLSVNSKNNSASQEGSSSIFSPVIPVYSDPIPKSISSSSFATSFTTAYCVLSWKVQDGTISDTVYIFRDNVKIAEVSAVTSYTDTTVIPQTEYNYTLKNRNGNKTASLRTTIPSYVRYKLSYDGGIKPLWKSVKAELVEGSTSEVNFYVDDVLKQKLFAKESFSQGFALEEASTVTCVLKDSKGHVISNEVKVSAIGSMQNPENSTALTSGSIYSSVKLHLSAPNAKSFVIIWENTETANSKESSITSSLTRKYCTADTSSDFLQLDISDKNISASTYLHFCIYPVDCDNVKYKAAHIWFYGAGTATKSSL